jgi:hypothetical protein
MSGNDDMEFLVRGWINSQAKTFGPFRSQERAEQTLVKVCGGFESCEILCKTKSKGIFSLTDKFFNEPKKNKESTKTEDKLQPTELEECDQCEDKGYYLIDGEPQMCICVNELLVAAIKNDVY